VRPSSYVRVRPSSTARAARYFSSAKRFCLRATFKSRSAISASSSALRTLSRARSSSLCLMVRRTAPKERPSGAGAGIATSLRWLDPARCGWRRDDAPVALLAIFKRGCSGYSPDRIGSFLLGTHSRSASSQWKHRYGGCEPTRGAHLTFRRAHHAHCEKHQYCKADETSKGNLPSSSRGDPSYSLVPRRLDGNACE
jgi:hypothetical protein